MSDNRPFRATALRDECDPQFDKNNTYVDAGIPFLYQNQHDSHFENAYVLGVDAEDVGPKTWRTASSMPPTFDSLQYNLSHDTRSSHTMYDQATTMYGAEASLVYDPEHEYLSRQNGPYPFPDASRYFPHGQVSLEDRKAFDSGFGSTLQPPQGLWQWESDERDSQQSGPLSSYHLQQPVNVDPMMGTAPIQGLFNPWAAADPLYSAQFQPMSIPGEVMMPGTNLVRLSHACFLGTIPLPRLAFHAPGIPVSSSTLEVLKRPIPKYKARANSMAHHPSTSSVDNSQTEYMVSGRGLSLKFGTFLSHGNQEHYQGYHQMLEGKSV